MDGSYYQEPVDESCIHWREWISALTDGEGNPSQRSAVWAHLRRCPPCRAYYRSLMAVKHRLQKVSWAHLLSEALARNRRMRRWAIVAVVSTAVLSVWATGRVVHYFFPTPTMTPLVAAGLYLQHLRTPPEALLNDQCPTGMACQIQHTLQIRAVPFMSLKRLASKVSAGLCDCVGQPVLIYRLERNGPPVFLLFFNANDLPLRKQGAGPITFAGRQVYCSFVSGLHVLLWHDGIEGAGIVAPQGQVNPFLLLPHLPRD